MTFTPIYPSSRPQAHAQGGPGLSVARGGLASSFRPADAGAAGGAHRRGPIALRPARPAAPPGPATLRSILVRGAGPDLFPVGRRRDAQHEPAPRIPDRAGAAVPRLEGPAPDPPAPAQSAGRSAGRSWARWWRWRHSSRAASISHRPMVKLDARPSRGWPWWTSIATPTRRTTCAARRWAGSTPRRTSPGIERAGFDAVFVTDHNTTAGLVPTDYRWPSAAAAR